MTIRLLIVFMGILTACSNEKSVNVFQTPNPEKEAIFHSHTDSVYYVIDSIAIDTGLYGKFHHSIGDTLFREIFDSLGNLIQTVSYPAFRTTSNYYYEKNGDLKFKTIQSDYRSEFYISNFVDTFKRLKYFQEIDPLSENPTGIIYFNKKGLPDSSLSFTMLQRRQVKYKEYFTYKNDTLVMTCKNTIAEDLKVAKETGTLILDTTKYVYANSKLSKIIKTEITGGNEKTIETKYFDNSERPTFKDIKRTKWFIRYKAKINAP